MKKTLCFIIALVMLLSLVACGSSTSSSASTPSSDNSASSTSSDSTAVAESNPPQKKITIKISHTGSEETPMNYAQLAFKEYIEEKSGGLFEVKMYPNGQLGNESECLQAVQSGDLELFACSTSALVNFNSRLSVLNIPFAFPDQETALAVLRGDFGQMLLDEMSDYGFKGMAFFESMDFRELTTNVEVHTPADLKGVKIRVMSSPDQIAIWESLGATPTTVAFAELYTALQQHTVDAQENPVENIVAMKFYEVQDYLVLTHHVITTGMIVCSPDFYDSLTPEQQDLLQEAINYAADYWVEYSANKKAEYLKEIEASGTEIITLTEEEAAAFKDAAAPAVDYFAGVVGQDLIDQMEAAVAAVK